MQPDHSRESADERVLTEAVNLRTGTVRVTGDLTTTGARSLCGTVWGLHREGYEHVFLDLVGVGRADDDGRAVVEDLLRGISDAGGELHVSWGALES